MTKQTNLFGETGEENRASLPVLEIYKPSRQDLKTASMQLYRFTKAELQELATPFLKIARRNNVVYKGEVEKGTPIEIVTLLKSSQQAKDVWEKFMCIFFNRHNLPLMFRLKPESEMRLWRETLTRHFIHESEAEKILGAKCFKRKPSFYSYSRELSDVLGGWFKYVRGYLQNPDVKYPSKEYGYYLCFSSLMYHLLFPAFFPEMANVKGFNELPVDAKLKTYTSEQTIFSKMPLVASLYETGKLSAGGSKLTAAAVKSAQKVVGFQDMFADCGVDKKYGNQCAALVMNIYRDYRDCMGRKKIPSAIEDQLKGMIDNAVQSAEMLLPVLLSHITGFKRAKLNMTGLFYVATMIKTLFKEHCSDGWLRVEELVMWLRTVEDGAESNFIILRPLDMEAMDLYNNFTCRYIFLDSLVSDIAVPVVKGLLVMLAALGMVEVAYRDVAESDASFYDCVRFVRVTELGKYWLGLTDRYEPKLPEGKGPLFELDNERFIIKSVVADNPYEPILADFADRITPSLYRVSYESFLKGCNGLSDVERKIDSFRRFVCSEPSKEWTDLFDRLKRRCKPFLAPDSKYILFRIDAGDKDLQRLLLTDPEVRKLVLKAEGYMLLVKSDDADRLSKLLRKHGYLV